MRWISSSATMDRMARTRRLKTRPPVKQQEIVVSLRQKIVDGIYAPGGRLPTRNELELAFDVSSVTIQRALEELIHDGFVYADGRRGTFVSQTPPHRTRYAVIFSTLQTELSSARRFWSALMYEAINIEHSEPRQLPLFYGIREGIGSQDLERLTQDIRAQRIAGLIFSSERCLVPDTPLVDAPNLPRVVIRSVSSATLPSVWLDDEKLVTRALDYFHARGRKRVALLTHGGWLNNPIRLDQFRKAAAARGMYFPQHWLQFGDLDYPGTARNVAQLLAMGNGKERPDALFIADDNLVEHAAGGIMAAGVAVPGDIELVGHCNFPWATPSVLPVKRLGYDAKDVLRACVDSIDAQRRGETVPSVTRIAPRFDDEM